MEDRVIALKVDVDTYLGMKVGVPNLLTILRNFDVRATFFLSFGPDNSGKAIWNVFRKRGFLSKMIRTGAPRMYGLRTLLYGTLLPPPYIASSLPEIVRRIDQEGHEIAVHAWDHRLWQDWLDRMSPNEIRREFEKSFAAFRQILGREPRATGAPAWYCNRESLEIQDGLGLEYCSDTREGTPFCPRIGTKVFRTLQIPSNQPCIEEIIGRGHIGHLDLVEHLIAGLKARDPNIVPVHAEAEGGLYQEIFRQFLKRSLSIGYQFWCLEQVGSLAKAHGVPTREIGWKQIKGRSGLVAVPVGLPS